MMLNGVPRCLLAALAGLLVSGGAVAQALPPAASGDATVARRGGVELTVAEVDVKIRSIPEELRAGYMTESDRAARLIDTMLLTKQLAVRARELGLDSDPEFLADLALVTTELLSRHAIERHVANSPMPNVEGLAYERYLADPAQDGHLTLTFEIVYGHAFKPARRVPVAEHSAVSLQDMRAMLRGAGRKGETS